MLVSSWLPAQAPPNPTCCCRAAWISENTLRWQAGWLFWFAVTLSFSWSYYALGRHLKPAPPWRSLAIGLALVAAAVDIVGVLVNMTVLPELANGLTNTATYSDPTLQVIFQSMENLSNALTNIAAFGLYSLAGLLLLPAVFATSGYPRWLAWLGSAEWVIASIATVLLVVSPDRGNGPFVSKLLPIRSLGVGKCFLVAAKETCKLKHHPEIIWLRNILKNYPTL